MAVEGDRRDFGWAGGGRRRELDDGVVAESAVVLQPDRPDAQAVGDGVIEPAIAHDEPEDAPFGRGEIPRRGVGAVEFGARDVDRFALAPRDGRKSLSGQSGDTVVVGAEIDAGEREAMDETAFAVRDVERLGFGVVCERAERRPGVGAAVGRHRRE